MIGGFLISRASRGRIGPQLVLDYSRLPNTYFRVTTHQDYTIRGCQAGRRGAEKAYTVRTIMNDMNTWSGSVMT